MPHDHQHTETELALSEALAQAQEHIRLVTITECLLRAALLSLLPNTGDEVYVEVESGLQLTEDNGTAIQKVRIFRDGDVLDIALA